MFNGSLGDFCGKTEPTISPSSEIICHCCSFSCLSVGGSKRVFPPAWLTLNSPPGPLLSGEACTIVLRGATQQILDEAERSLHDALCVLAQTVKEPRTVFGGGTHTANTNIHFIHTHTLILIVRSYSASVRLLRDADGQGGNRSGQ